MINVPAVDNLIDKLDTRGQLRFPATNCALWWLNAPVSL